MIEGDKTILQYKCDCGSEFRRVVPKGERKRKGFCKACKSIVYPSNSTKITTTENKGRTVKVKWPWE